jgi:hypothetical protein
MKNKPLYFFHLLFSVTFLIVSLTISIRDILLPGRFSIGNFFLFTFPACLVPFIIPLALFYWKIESSLNIKYLPLRINFANIVITIILFLFDTAYPDLAFQFHFGEYVNAVDFVQQGKQKIDEYGYASLPEEYESLSSKGVIYITFENEVTTIYFADGADNSDALSWGYLYRSDSSTPTEEGGCVEWRSIQPPKANWYYCDINSEWAGFIFGNR